jgi:hypothetical protein
MAARRKTRAVRGASTYRVRDLIQAIQGAARAGLEVRRIDIEPTGAVHVSVARPNDGVSWDVDVNKVAAE